MRGWAKNMQVSRLERFKVKLLGAAPFTFLSVFIILGFIQIICRDYARPIKLDFMYPCEPRRTGRHNKAVTLCGLYTPPYAKLQSINLKPKSDKTVEMRSAFLLMAFCQRHKRHRAWRRKGQERTAGRGSILAGCAASYRSLAVYM